VTRVVIAVVSAALAAGSAAQATATPSGLFGVVTAGPTTPVCIAGRPCTKPASGVVLTFSLAGTAGARATARPDGSYRVRLAPGLYAARASYGRLEPATVRVRAGAMRRVDFSIDTGIR
jgi:hypothetical protein